MSNETRNIFKIGFKWLWVEIHRGNVWVVGTLAVLAFLFGKPYFDATWDAIHGNSAMVGQTTMDMGEIAQKLKLLEEKFNKQSKELRTGVPIKIEI